MKDTTSYDTLAQFFKEIEAVYPSSLRASMIAQGANVNATELRKLAAMVILSLLADEDSIGQAATATGNTESEAVTVLLSAVDLLQESF